MKKIKAFRLLGLSCLSLSLLLTACEKENVTPTGSLPPVTETPSGGSDGSNSGGGKGPTTPAGPTTTPPTTGTGNLLTQVGHTRMAYDAQGRLKQYTSMNNFGYEVLYEGDKIAKLIHHDVHNTGKHFYTLYTYTGSKVTSAVTYNGYNEVAYRLEFEYAGDKLVKELKNSFVRSATGHLTENVYAYDGNDNLTSIAVRSAPSGNAADLSHSYIINFGNHDSQPNPKPYADTDIYLPGIKLSRNNAGYKQSSSSKELYTYVYSPITNLPIQQAISLDGYNQVPPAVTTYTYQ